MDREAGNVEYDMVDIHLWMDYRREIQWYYDCDVDRTLQENENMNCHFDKLRM